MSYQDYLLKVKVNQERVILKNPSTDNVHDFGMCRHKMSSLILIFHYQL